MREKRRLYAEFRAAGLGETDAALNAGYDPRSCKRIGRDLMKDRTVIADINRIKKALAVNSAPLPLPGSDTQFKDAGVMPRLAKPLPPEVGPDGLMLDPCYIAGTDGDPKAFLKAVMDNPRVDLAKRIDAAKTLMPFEYGKPADAGKKGAQRLKADEAVQGRFGPQAAPPQLKAVPKA